MENNSAPGSILENQDELADVLAECVVYLNERGLLDGLPAPAPDLPVLPKEAMNSNVIERP